MLRSNPTTVRSAATGGDQPVMCSHSHGSARLGAARTRSPRSDSLESPSPRPGGLEVGWTGGGEVRNSSHPYWLSIGIDPDEKAKSLWFGPVVRTQRAGPSRCSERAVALVLRLRKVQNIRSEVGGAGMVGATVLQQCKQLSEE